jgi:hypothetical protein
MPSSAEGPPLAEAWHHAVDEASLLSQAGVLTNSLPIDPEGPIAHASPEEAAEDDSRLAALRMDETASGLGPIKREMVKYVV